MNKFQEAYFAIKQSKRILLCTHFRPDGDALSSLTAMMLILKNLGKTYLPFCQGPLGSNFSYLRGIEEVVLTVSEEEFNQCDLIISLDCGSLARTGISELILSRRSEQTFIEIDHHPKVEHVSDLELRFPSSASTTEIIYKFCQINGLAIDRELATCILTGLASDTGGFVYPSTTETAMSVAAQMLWRGANLPDIIKRAFYKQSLTAMRMWGLAMSRLTVNERYGIAFTVLTYKDFQLNNADETMTDELAGWLACLDGVKAVLFLHETKPGLIKGSWRSVDPKVDVSRYARRFGGGGHVRAAGFAINGTLKETGSGWEINIDK